MKSLSVVMMLMIIVISSCTVKNTLKEGEEMVSKPESVSEEIRSEPEADKQRTVSKYHGRDLYDDYAWIKTSGRDDAKVKSHLDSESRYAREKFKELSELEEKIYNEIISRVDQTDVSVPVKKDEYFYYTKEKEGDQYHIYCRKHGSMEADEEILLDLNELAQDFDYLDLGFFRVSPDHKNIAYSIDTTGEEKYTLFIKDLSRNRLYTRIFENVDDLEWAESKEVFFYTTVNEKNRSDKLFRHVLKTDPKSDRLMYEEKDESFSVWIEKSRNREYLFLGLSSKNATEIHYLKSNDAMGFFEMITPRKTGVEYYPEHSNGLFYFLTNDDDSHNFKIMTVEEKLPVRVLWKNFLDHRSNIYLDDLDIFNDYMVLSEIEDGKRNLVVIDFETMNSMVIRPDEECYSVYAGSNPMFDSRKFRYVYESLKTPYSIIEHDVETGQKSILKEQKVLGGFDPGHYRSELVYASAPDGEKVPVSLVYRTDMFRKDGTNPLLLEAYGAYGDFNDPSFSVSRLSLLDRGFVYAIAHVRGGLEKGKKWHLDGMLLNKKNTFTDFIACSEFLIKNGYTSTDKLIITGGSAGGMLIGTVLNMRPELFRAAVLDVPFVDVLNTMLDPGLAATVTEYDEWGSPLDKEYFDYIRSYCPYQNIKAQDYPDVLVIAGMNDPRISYWEPAKWTAKLREYNTAETEAVLYMSSSGHGGSSGRYDYYKETAKKFAYILNAAGLTE